MLALARPAHADCPIEGCGGGGGTAHVTYSSTLTVTRPATGTITSSPSGINCPAGSGGTCTHTDSQTLDCADVGDCPERPTDGWTSYTLSATGGGTGYTAHWHGACSGTSSCEVTLDDDKSVSLTWDDTQFPSVSLTSPSKVGPGAMNVSATASDNAAVSQVRFYLDGVLKATDSSAPYGASIDMSSQSEGSHTVMAQAVDTSGWVSSVSHSVTVDKTVNLSVDSVPAYTNALSLPIGFTTDPDVVSRQCEVDDDGWSACSSPFSPAIAAERAYSVHIRVTDDVGNVAVVTRSFVVDRTAPSASFTSGPSEGATIPPGSVTFGFAGSDASPYTVACRVDAGAAGPCSSASTETVDGLADGAHSVTLIATDSAGNVTQVTRHFTIASSPAQGVLGAGPTGGGSGGGGNASAPLNAKLSAGFKLKSKKTLVRKLMITGLPAGATVKVSCKGKGCPFKSKSFVAKSGKLDLTKAFKGRKLGKGIRIEIDVVNGSQTQVFKLSTRAGKKPVVKTA